LGGKEDDMERFIIEVIKLLAKLHKQGVAWYEAALIKREAESEALVPLSDRVGGYTMSRRGESTSSVSPGATADVTEAYSGSSRNPASPENVEARKKMILLVLIIGIAAMVFIIIFKMRRK
jgi:hypothetical protein